MIKLVGFIGARHAPMFMLIVTAYMKGLGSTFKILATRITNGINVKDTMTSGVIAAINEEMILIIYKKVRGFPFAANKALMAMY